MRLDTKALRQRSSAADSTPVPHTAAQSPPGRLGEGMQVLEIERLGFNPAVHLRSMGDRRLWTRDEVCSATRSCKLYNLNPVTMFPRSSAHQVYGRQAAVLVRGGVQGEQPATLCRASSLLHSQSRPGIRVPGAARLRSMGGKRPWTWEEVCRASSPAAGTASSSTSAQEVADRPASGGGAACGSGPATDMRSASCRCL